MSDFRTALAVAACASLLIGGVSPATAQQTQPSVGEITDLINTVVKNKDAFSELSSGSSDTGTRTYNPSPSVPAPTQPAPVNSAPSTPGVGTIRLTDQKQINDSSASSNVQVKTGGRTFENSILSNTWVRSASVEYALSNQFRNLNSTIGISDFPPKSNAKVVVKFIGDNRVIAEHEVAFPHTRNVNVNVTGINRLRIEFYHYETSTGHTTTNVNAVLAYSTLSR